MNLSNLIQETTSKKVESILKAFAENRGLELNQENHAQMEQTLSQLEEFVYAQFTGKNYEGKELVNVPALSLTEALSSSDVSIVFPRVISQILSEPVEPNLFLQNSVAEVITLPDNAPLLVEFPSVGALTAFDMAEGQEYTKQTLSYVQNQTSIRIGKIGVAAALNEELIRHSMWNLVDLHLRACRRAIDRKKEGHLFRILTERAKEVFNNNLTADMFTTGKAVAGSASVNNGSFSYFDLVKMCGVVLQANYEPTHFLAHPLTWPIFAQDPILRAQFYHGGQLGAGIWTRTPQYDQQAAFPFGITYVPYYAIPYTENTVLTSTLSGQGSAPVVSDVYLIDKANSLFMATRGDVQIDQMDDWLRDAKMLKAKQHVGVAAKDQGRGMTVARNVRIVPNEEPLFTIRQVTS